MTDWNRVVIGCVVTASNKNYSNLETEYLFRTLNRFGGEASKAKKWACFLEEPTKIMKEVLQELGVIIKIVKPFDKRDPYSNKIRLVEESIKEDIDYLMVLDNDILIAEDFSSFISGDSIKAKPANYDVVGFENWKVLFDYFNLKFPTNRVKTIVTQQETIPYFGSGVMIIPKKYIKILFETWSDFIHTLSDDREKGKFPKALPNFQTWNEQVSFALTLAKTNLDCSSLPLKMNYSTNLTIPEEENTNIQPLLIHHHHYILDDGDIMPSSYDHINEIIDKLNKFLKNEKRLEVTSSNILPIITRLLVKDGKFSEVIKRLSTLPIDYDDPILHYHLAKAYQQTEQYTKSLTRFSASLKKGFQSPFNIYLSRGNMFLKMGQIINAENDFKKALECHKNDEVVLRRLSIVEKRKKLKSSLKQKEKSHLGYEYSKYGKYWRKLTNVQYNWMYTNRPLLHENFQNYIKSKNDVKTILEVGCGTGVYPIQHKDLFSNMEYTGIDFAEQAIEYCKNNSEFNFMAGDFIKMNLEKKYDLVFSHAVIDHVYDVSGFLSSIVKACKKYAYVSAFNGYCPELSEHQTPWSEETGSYHSILSINEIKKTLLECGLDENEFLIRKQKGGNVVSPDKVFETIIEITKN